MEELGKLIEQYDNLTDKVYDPSVIKQCVFCGENPVSKNKEHILPRWLIEYTGDPKRPMNLPVWDFEKRAYSMKQVAFDQFVFPACEICNNRFAELEGKAKQAFLGLLEKRTINMQCAEILLDWFDKVRVGLWLAAQVWDKSPTQIQPKFHIQDRIAMHDRILWFSSCKQSQKCLRATGINDQIFKFIPSYVSLRVCNMAFVSASAIGLCAGPLGLPRIKIHRRTDDRHVDADIVMPNAGKRFNWPAAPTKFHMLAQACYSDLLRDIEIENSIRDRMIDKSKSKPHLYYNDRLVCLNDSAVKLDLYEYALSEDLSKAELQLYGKLRRHIVNAIPHHVEKSSRVWRKIMKRMLFLFPIGSSEVRQ
ncbi:MAG: hypothetical protein H8E73_02085 [Planctomycetes bacterium]|nr:hypothetical protein [Planctomycetota bacterium]MBL7185297.1 hypothetical protein [Phycisphaerae bacterium]